jgi:CheY-like chemotaxis protein
MSPKNWQILVVEDDPDGQVVVATILEHLNISIDVANNAEEAENYLFQMGRQYTAAILDLALPGKDGWELLAEIQSYQETADLPCIAVTAFHTSKLREDAIKAGFLAYFAKPIEATTFARSLEALL